MDKFDDKVSQMQSQINTIKKDIDLMKSKNKKTIGSIMDSIQNLSKPHIYKSERSYQATPRNRVNKEADFQLNEMDYNVNDERMLRKTRSNVTIRDENYRGGYCDKEQLKMIDIRRRSDYAQTPQHNSQPFVLKKTSKRFFPNDTLTPQAKPQDRKPNDAKPIPHQAQHQQRLEQVQEGKEAQMRNDNCFKLNDLDSSSNNPNELQHTPKYINQHHYPNHNRNHFNNNASRPLSHHEFERNNFNKRECDKNEICIKIVQDLVDVYSIQSHEVVKPEELVERVKRDFFNNKTKDDFINSVYRLYLTTMPPDNNKKTDIGDLWEWIRSNHMGRENNCSQGERAGGDIYKAYCEGIMEEYDLRTFEEMKEFLDELLLKNNKNEKFVEGMKKILCNDIGRKRKNGNLSSSNTTNNNTYAC